MKKCIFNKISLIIIISLMPIIMTGCDTQMLTFAESTLNQEITSRCEANEKILDELNDAGFLSDETYAKYSKHLAELAAHYDGEVVELTKKAKEATSASDIDVNTSFIPAIHYYNYVDGKRLCQEGGHSKIIFNDKEVTVCGCSTSTTGTHSNMSGAGGVTDLSTLMLVNFLGSKGKLENYSTTATGSTPYYHREGCAPLVLIDETVAAEINARFACDIYVLNPDMISTQGIQTLDQVIAAVKGSISVDDKGKATVNDTAMLKYFSPAKNEAGDKITLLDSLPEYTLIKTSRDQALNEANPKTIPGYDSVIEQLDTPCFTVKYEEFDSVAYNNIRALLGINNRQYIYSSAGGGRMYLLEYPVSVIKELKNDGNNAVITFTEPFNSGIGINLYTEEVIKYDATYVGTNGSVTFSKKGTPVSELVDSYLTVKGAPNETFDGQSAFVINGKTQFSVTFDVVNRTKDLQVARILLRDYLEATYAPEMVDNEDLVVFGRKIRLDLKNFNDSGDAVWDKDEIMAYYVDKDGKILQNSPTLKSNDFCNATSLLSSTPYVKKIYNKSDTEYVVIPAKELEEGVLPTIKDLKEERVISSIKPTILFPGPKCGVADFGENGEKDSDSKQRFYAIATSKGIFDSGLYNKWINTTDPNASLDWWNKYLTDNNFTYRVAHQDVNKYLLNNYSYELSESGVIMLDLDTVAFIQEQMTEENDTERTEIIRTIFVILGWFLICYSVILMLAWIIDTNSDMGIDLLNKLTLGNWIAIKYPEDIPNGDLSNTKYISCTGMVLSFILLMVIGIILINVDIVKIVMLLINTFGRIAMEIEKMIKGSN